jgi:regulatory protein
MAVVTGLRPRDGRAGRYVVEVGGEPAGTVSLAQLERLGLRLGELLDESRLAALRSEAAATKTFDRALHMLAARGRASADLRRQLVARGEPAEHAASAVARLLELGVLDDGAYARQFARSRVGVGHGARRILADLLRKGVPAATAQEAVRQVLDEPETLPQEALDRLVERKLRVLARLDSPARDRRLQVFLARRGYGYEAIQAAVKRVRKAA